MDIIPSSVSSTLQSLSEQLQVERARLSSFMDPKSPNFVQGIEGIRSLESSLDSLGLSLADIPNLDAITAIKESFQLAHREAETVLQIYSQDEKFENPKEELEDLVQLIVEQEERLACIPNYSEDTFLIESANHIMEKNKGRLLQRITNLWLTAVDFTKAGLSIQIGHGAILRMLHSLGAQETELHTTGLKVTAMLDRVLAGESLEDSGLRLTFTKTRHDGSLQQLLSEMTKLLSFIFVQLCESDKQVFAYLDLPLSSSLLAAVKKRVCDPSFRGAQIPAITTFFNLLKSINCAPGVLKQIELICKHTDTAIINLRCETLIESIRELILSPDTLSRTISDETERWSYSSKQGKNDDYKDCFVLEKMQVTENTHKIVETLQDFLEEAVNLPKAAALEMVLAVRTCVQLFLFLRLRSQENNIRNSCAAAALFHNDCIYFSHHLVLITAEICPRLPEDVRNSCLLCEFEPLLRFRASECFLTFCSEVEHVLNNKLTFLQHAELSEHFLDLQETLQSACSLLCGLARSLENILRRTTYLQCLGRLVDFTLTALLQKIFTLKQIPANDEVALQQLIDELLTLATLFGKEEPNIYVASWEKLEVVKQVLESDINGIMKLFAGGKLAKALTTDEIQKLLEAMFEDSPRRQECLRSMTGRLS